MAKDTRHAPSWPREGSTFPAHPYEGAPGALSTIGHNAL